MGVSKRASNKPKTTVVDVGFGRAERISSWTRGDRPDRVVWGVERPHRKREKGKRIRGAHISYVGVIKWLKRQRNGSIKIVNGDFVLNNVFRGCACRNRENFIRLFNLLRKRLVANGRVYFNVFKSSASDYIYLMGLCGFRVTTEKLSGKEELKTYWSKKHFSRYNRSKPVRLVFRPGEPTGEQRELIARKEEAREKNKAADAEFKRKRIREKETARLEEDEYHAMVWIGSLETVLDLLGRPLPRVDLEHNNAMHEMERLMKEYGDLPLEHRDLLSKQTRDKELKEILDDVFQRAKRVKAAQK